MPFCQMPSTVIQSTLYKSYYTAEKNQDEEQLEGGRGPKHRIRLLFQTISLTVLLWQCCKVTSATSTKVPQSRRQWYMCTFTSFPQYKIIALNTANKNKLWEINLYRDTWTPKTQITNAKKSFNTWKDYNCWTPS